MIRDTLDKKVIEKANEYIYSIMPTDPNSDPSEYESEYNAFIAGALLFKEEVERLRRGIDNATTKMSLNEDDEAFEYLLELVK